MAIRKSELYSSLWASCDELRGGMDASQYKDYVLVMLFIKYVSDKYTGQPFAAITVPEGASFSDMVRLKGTPTIGDDINKKIVEPLAKANRLSDMPDFNDVNKLGSGTEMVQRLTNLIAIFEDKRLDFSRNRADGDDILGDAYEYLMQHFAKDSGKSKGQFYTPSEVSRIIAKVVGITPENSSADTTVYDPTCGSGSLLLKVADEAGNQVTIYGQEKDSATTGLARMNMILHKNPTAEIKQGNTLANPLFKDQEGRLRRFDYVVANPPFSDKRWTNGVNAPDDPHGRFRGYGVPPDKNGDFAYLLHIIRSLKSSGKGACILPHGVLFRGNAEAEIRRNLIQRGYIKGIIGLPANLFYGTGIPACLIVIDKAEAESREHIFMIDASRGFTKDGPKNRLRSMDLHKIVDVFNRQLEWERYSRRVPVAEIEANDYNLNIPRYIDSQEEEDQQNIEAHLLGDIPVADVEALSDYWQVYPSLRRQLFQQGRHAPYVRLTIGKEAIKETIFAHPEFSAYTRQMAAVFAAWKQASMTSLKSLEAGCQPKQVIHALSEHLLQQYSNRALVNKYDVYQHLMDYWAETMQDDLYLIAADGWRAETYRVLETVKAGKKKGQEVDKGWACDLVPKPLIVDRYFADQQATIDQLQQKLESVSAERATLEEEHDTEEGALGKLDKINQGEVKKCLKELKTEPTLFAMAAEPASGYGEEEDREPEAEVLKRWLRLYDQESTLKKKIKTAEETLDRLAYEQYPQLSEADIKTLVVDDKWMTALETAIRTEMEAISQRLTQRIQTLAERYEQPLPELTNQVATLESKVQAHLEKMGFTV